MGKNDWNVWSNTQKSTSFRQFMWGLAAIVFTEGLVVGAALFFYLKKDWLFLLLIIVWLTIYFYALNSIRMMIQSSHVVRPNEISFRLGSRFKCTVPLSLVADVREISFVSPPKPDLVGITICRDNENLYCLTRHSDTIHISLSTHVLVKAPQVAKEKNRQGLVKEIYINADDPEGFLKNIAEAAPNVRIKEARCMEFPNSKRAERHEETPVRKSPLPRVTAGQPPALEIRHLTKYFGAFPAVQDLCLDVYPGEIFGFLGANGAGKSTTIKMITGFLRPTKGTVAALGEDLWRPGAVSRRRIGFVPDTPLIYDRLTARELLITAAHLYDLPAAVSKDKIEELLSLLDLQPWSSQIIANYSMGMQRKVSIALALLPDPNILIVDELTNAFDAPTLATIKKMLLSLRTAGKTVFLSTHVMDVAEKLCDRIGIIHKGKLIALGTVEELCRYYEVQDDLESLFLKLVGISSKTRGDITDG